VRTDSTPEVVSRFLASRAVFSTREVAEAARVSRQAAQKFLQKLVESGRLTIEGRARAARYRRVDDSSDAVLRPVVDSGDRWSEVDGFRGAAQLADYGTPYAAVPLAPVAPDPTQVTLDVASAGSLFRLSARILLADLEANEALLDFRGVMDIGDEFLEEIFHVWGRAHPGVRLIPINVSPDWAELVDRYVG